MTNTAILILLLAGVGCAVFAILVVGLLQLLKRQSARDAAQIKDTTALPRWSTLHLEEVARLRAKPKRLARSHRGFHPWEETQAQGERPQSNEL